MASISELYYLAQNPSLTITVKTFPIESKENAKLLQVAKLRLLRIKQFPEGQS